MPCDQQIVGVLIAKHLNPDQFALDYNGVGAIRQQAVHTIEPRQSTPVRSHEADIMSKQRPRAA